MSNISTHIYIFRAQPGGFRHKCDGQENNEKASLAYEKEEIMKEEEEEFNRNRKENQAKETDRW